MRKLLTRLAELEPATCKPVENDYFKITLDNDNWHTVYPDNLTPQDLMWIQWAVQEAIVARGWGFEMQFNTDWPGKVETMVGYGVSWTSSEPVDNPAEALLEAYLKALGSER